MQKKNCEDTQILLPTKSNIELCAKHLNNGFVVAFATETVYGLGANIFDCKAVSQIFEIKNRPTNNPLIVHVASLQQIYSLAVDISEDACKLMQAFMPGPLTVVLRKRAIVPDIVTAGQNTVAIRIPDNKVALQLLKTCDNPICAPSANTSTRPSPTKSQHVYDDLCGKIKYILQSEQDCNIGIESTIVDMTGINPIVLRLGGVTVEDIARVLQLEIDVVLNPTKTSPGTKYRHYAPKIPLRFLPHDFDMKDLQMLYSVDASIILCQHTLVDRLYGFNLIDMGNEAQYAANVYGQMRLCETKYKQIIAIGLKSEGIGASVNNRLIKASGL